MSADWESVIRKLDVYGPRIGSQPVAIWKWWGDECLDRRRKAYIGHLPASGRTRKRVLPTRLLYPATILLTSLALATVATLRRRRMSSSGSSSSCATIFRMFLSEGTSERATYLELTE